MKIVGFFTAAFIVVASAVSSAQELNYNLVNLYSTAQSKIDNDVLLVTMISAADAATAKEAAAIVNQQMKWAHSVISEAENLKKQTVNYQTRPRYQNNVIVGWSVSHQLQLESQEIEELSSLVGRLQERLQVSTMQFRVSPERKKLFTNDLIIEALEAFKAKATLIASQIGSEEFRIVTINISENAPPIPRQRGFAMEAMPMTASDSPQAEAGESDLSVRIDGTIQLVF